MARVMLTVRSGPSRKVCYLRFINRTSRKVNVIWIDYGGWTRNYGTLDPNRHFDVCTYEGHPWICEDAVTKSRMLLNKAKIFYHSSSDEPQPQPQPNREIRCPMLSNNVACIMLPMLPNNELNDGCGLKRECVFITLPVFSLVELCAEVIVRNVHSGGDIRSLEIPTRLKTMLQSYYLHP